MQNKFSLVLLSTAVLSLAACGQTNYEDHLGDYVHTMSFHDNFNILQLTDIHWNYNTSTLASRGYLDKLFHEVKEHLVTTQGVDAKIDLVELTGDQFMLANAYHVDSFVKYFDQKAEEYGFKYAVIWGNHDHHGIYNPNWLSDMFKNAKHAIYSDENDNLYGRSNFVINLMSGEETKWQIANLDSGASFSETAVSPFRDYDYIRPEQTKWWKAEHDRVGKDVPTIAYYHIPQEENQKAWDDIHDKGATYRNKFFKLESFADNGNEKYASDFLDVGAENGLKAAFMGHAHNNDWTVECEFEDAEHNVNKVVVGLGVKTGPELYYAHINVEDEDPAMKEGLASVGITENFDLIGASLVTIKDGAKEGNFDLEHLYLNEDSSEKGYKNWWVKW